MVLIKAIDENTVLMYNVAYLMLDALQNYKRTKILATLGPASSTEAIIQDLIQHGMSAVRLNFSHGTHEDHAKRIEIIRSLEKKLHTHIAIIQDLQGPKIRLGILTNDEICLTDGEKVTLVHGEVQKDENIPVQYNIFPYLQEGHHIFINDGISKLRVIKINKTSAECLVVAGGEIKSRKGVNLPDTNLPEVAFTPKDAVDLKMGIKHKVDYIAISFVQTGEDILHVKKLISQNKHQPKIIVKIETKTAIKHLEQIIQYTDAVMIARGDLAVEVGQEEVPILQRTITRLTKKYNKPVIVATQMLESMINNVVPTRAEVNDVATAVLDQVDAVMLSAETASGHYPVKTVVTMNKIIKHVEHSFKENHKLYDQVSIEASEDQTTAISAAASLLAHQLHATLIFALTASGNTALRLSSYRPHAPIIALTDSLLIAQQLSLVWGIVPYYLPDIHNNEKAYAEIISQLLDKGEIKKDDKVVLVTGRHPGIAGHTNIINVTRVGETF